MYVGTYIPNYCLARKWYSMVYFFLSFHLSRCALRLSHSGLLASERLFQGHHLMGLGNQVYNLSFLKAPVFLRFSFMLCRQTSGHQSWRSLDKSAGIAQSSAGMPGEGVMPGQDLAPSACLALSFCSTSSVVSLPCCCRLCQGP